MIVSFRLLKELIEFSYTPEELASKLTSIGIEVEGIRKIEKIFDSVFTAKIEKLEKIIDTKLFKVRVSLNKNIFDVVTAATNLKEGDIVPLAIPGAKLANGTRIEIREFSGYPSQGMLCSYNELGLDSDVLSQEEKEGILVFPEETPLDMPIEEILPIEDILMELSLLPDRADAFYVLGLARWIEIICSRDSKRAADFSKFTPLIKLKLAGKKLFPIAIEDSKLCDVYSGRIIEGVKVKKSTYNLRKELFKLRIRPINNIVDVTNYVAKLYGQPLHAFDLDKLNEKILVRTAKPGENIKTLDGITRHLNEYNLLITDKSGPIAIAGVMGGENTSVTYETVNILLESAHFAPFAISRSSRSIPLITDASTLFEKGTDPQFPSTASKIAASLIEKEAGGIPYEENILDLTTEEEPIKVRFSKINSLLGASLPKEEVKKLLSFEGINFTEKENYLEIFPPTYRQDLHIEEDIIEEVVRMKGYNEFGEIPIYANLKSGTRTEFEIFIWSLKDLLVNLGLQEAYTPSLISISMLNNSLLKNSDTVEIINPLTEDMSILRPSLFPTMLYALEKNCNMQNNNIAFFEIGNIFQLKEGFPYEHFELGIILSGDRIGTNPMKKSLSYDFLYLKGIVEQVLEYNNINYTFNHIEIEFLHPYQSAGIFVDNENIGVVGKINRELIKNAYFASIDVEKLFMLGKKEKSFKPFSIYPSVKRDIAVIVNKDISEVKLREAIISAGIQELLKIELFDVYEGSPLPEDKKNLAYSLEFSSLERTLKSEEVDKFIELIEHSIAEKTKGEIRKK